MPQIDLSILNQRQTPAFYADVLANRPAAGFIGRIFVSTNTFEFYRDNGTGWDLIGGPGTGTITGGGSLYRVGIWTSTSNLGESNNLVFDYSTNRLGINTNTPGASLDVHSAASSIAQFNQTTATNNSLLVLQNSGSALWRIGNFYNSGANDFGVFDVVGAIQPVTIKKTTGQVLIGTSTVGSGKLVVSSATGDNGVQIVGASAPSLRIDNAETGPTKRAGLGISTDTNNFIQGSADRDFCIFNGSTAAASPMLFGIYDAGLTNVQEAARISAARNFLVNSVVDSGEKLQISGVSIFKYGTTERGAYFTHNNGTTAQIVLGNGSQAGTGAVEIHRNGSSAISMRSTSVVINPSRLASTSSTFVINGPFGAASLGTSISLSSNVIDAGVYTATSGTQNTVIVGAGANEIWSPSSGNATYNLFSISPVINTSGTYAGIVRGLFYNPSLTSITGVTHRAIETTTGDVCLGTTSGSLLVGTTTNAGQKFQVNGTARISSSLEALQVNVTGQTGAGHAFCRLNDNGTILRTSNWNYNPTSTNTWIGGSEASSSIFTINSTTKGFIPPRLTTAQKNAIVAPVAGLLVYDETLNKLAIYTGAAWETVTSI